MKTILIISQLLLLTVALYSESITANDSQQADSTLMRRGYIIEIGKYGIGLCYYRHVNYTEPGKLIAEPTNFFSNRYTMILLHSTYFKIPLSPFYTLLLLIVFFSTIGFIMYLKLKPSG